MSFKVHGSSESESDYAAASASSPRLSAISAANAAYAESQAKLRQMQAEAVKQKPAAAPSLAASSAFDGADWKNWGEWSDDGEEASSDAEQRVRETSSGSGSAARALATSAASAAAAVAAPGAPKVARREASSLPPLRQFLATCTGAAPRQKTAAAPLSTEAIVGAAVPAADVCDADGNVRNDSARAADALASGEYALLLEEHQKALVRYAVGYYRGSRAMRDVAADDLDAVSDALASAMTRDRHIDRSERGDVRETIDEFNQLTIAQIKSILDGNRVIVQRDVADLYVRADGDLIGQMGTGAGERVRSDSAERARQINNNEMVRVLGIAVGDEAAARQRWRALVQRNEALWRLLAAQGETQQFDDGAAAMVADAYSVGLVVDMRSEEWLARRVDTYDERRYVRYNDGDVVDGAPFCPDEEPCAPEPAAKVVHHYHYVYVKPCPPKSRDEGRTGGDADDDECADKRPAHGRRHRADADDGVCEEGDLEDEVDALLGGDGGGDADDSECESYSYEEEEEEECDDEQPADQDVDEGECDEDEAGGEEECDEEVSREEECDEETSDEDECEVEHEERSVTEEQASGCDNDWLWEDGSDSGSSCREIEPCASLACQRTFERLCMTPSGALLSGPAGNAVDSAQFAALRDELGVFVRTQNRHESGVRVALGGLMASDVWHRVTRKDQRHAFSTALVYMAKELFDALMCSRSCRALLLAEDIGALFTELTSAPFGGAAPATQSHGERRVADYGRVSAAFVDYLVNGPRTNDRADKFELVERDAPYFLKDDILYPRALFDTLRGALLGVRRELSQFDALERNFIAAEWDTVALSISSELGSRMPERDMPRPLRDTPQPVAPQPVAPQPVAPQPVAPQPVAPQPTTPQPVAPQPAQAKIVEKAPVVDEDEDEFSDEAVPIAAAPVVAKKPSPKKPAKTLATLPAKKVTPKKAADKKPVRAKSAAAPKVAATKAAAPKAKVKAVAKTVPKAVPAADASDIYSRFATKPATSSFAQARTRSSKAPVGASLRPKASSIYDRF